MGQKFVEILEVMIMKNFRKIMCIICSVFVFMSINVPAVNAAENDNIAVPASIKTVNTTITDRVSQGGCWGNLVFRVTGNYEYTYVYGAYELVGTNISASVESMPVGWTVVVDSLDYELNGTSLRIYINYHFRSSYYDCAYTGGYVYTTVQGVI